MKTTRILSLAAAVLTLAACGNEEFIENNPGNEAAKPVPMTFTAGMPQTRTQLDGLNVHWVEYDEIAIWDGSGAYQKFMVDAESINGSNATFSGTALPGVDYTAFYPLIAVESMTNTSVTFNLPAEQTPVAGTFANQLAPSLAKATGGSTDLEFNNLCALVKFTVPADMAGEGIFTLVGGNGEPLAGKYWVEYSTGNQTPGSERYKRVTLKGNFEAGKDYYFVVLPSTLTKGFSLLYEDGTGKLYRKATGKSVTLTAGRILNLGPLALTGFEKAVVKAIYAKLGSGTATENADGTVTLSDADLTALAAMTTLDLNGSRMTSSAGLGYCTALTTLKCANNQLTELNLSGLTKLTTLWCQMNQLTTLDVSGLTQLTELWCFDNKLTKLDITRLTNLNRIYCGRQKDSRQLTLTLTAAQEGVWNSWSSDRDNVRVTLDVK
ncbi:leucine-rich repeat domain-containing protein [Bacteroides caecigallinarum]|uniref:leucine-rich repeat domain-containing protein n=1 Tax=Bacteroides caecigallinarum TaxID=1411144 RepID=UPI001F343043|nr:leucine-rich repeat domain-containing protein [Bacteroides caecigallinarum]MCF2592615.1 leucine-rich repeat domain-containing protein [Bacteroides caecigallinarum]